MSYNNGESLEEMQKWKTGFRENIPWRELKHAPLVGYGKSNKFMYDSTYSGRNAA
jgi:hypothetical protein